MIQTVANVQTVQNIEDFLNKVNCKSILLNMILLKKVKFEQRLFANCKIYTINI